MKSMNSRLASATAAVLLLLAASCASTDGDSSDEDAPKGIRTYEQATGPNAVGVIPEGSITDPQRQKEISLSVEYPIKGGPYPLIVFSHGFGGSSRGYLGLSSFWASHGYVVIKPTHADAGRGSNLREALDELSREGEPEWRNRVRDVTAVLDRLDALEEKYPELKGKIDRSRIGVGGHSYGAFTAMVAGGATPAVGPNRLTPADPRVKAVIAMSPQGPTERQKLTAESFATLTAPTLFMTGSRDIGAEGEDAAWRRRAFELSAPGGKYFVSIEGAHHFSFSGRLADATPEDTRVRDERIVTERDPFGRPTATAPMRPRGDVPLQRERGIFGIVKATSLAFWDAQLKGETTGRDYLEGLRNRSGIEYATR
jgi:predicted dienelactone hydrolase